MRFYHDFGGDEDMGSIFLNILFSFHIIASLGLVLLILLHAGRGGGISGLFSGMVETFDGAGIVEKNLDRITIILGLVFTVTTIMLFIFL
ncbi:MAG TPA: preprotein translocase subunit SecG [Candidatus Hydromicrobium sp.]